MSNAGYMFDVVEALSGQELLDYIGANLQVEYSFGRVIVFHNGGTKDIPTTSTTNNWTVYFNQASAITGNCRVFLGDGGGLAGLIAVVGRVDGWLLSMRFVDYGWISRTRIALRSNETVIVVARAPFASPNCAFPRWYVAAPGLRPRVIRSTAGDDADFVRVVKRWPPAARFDRNRVDDLGRSSVGRILPTPLRVEFPAKTTSAGVSIDRTWVISYDDSLNEEAAYLSGKCDIVRPSSRI